MAPSTTAWIVVLYGVFETTSSFIRAPEGSAAKTGDAIRRQASRSAAIPCMTRGRKMRPESRNGVIIGSLLPL